jgi:hypothetical protein
MSPARWAILGGQASSRAATLSGARGLDLSNNQNLVIWCEQFSVLIQSADLMRKTS